MEGRELKVLFPPPLMGSLESCCHKRLLEMVMASGVDPRMVDESMVEEPSPFTAWYPPRPSPPPGQTALASDGSMSVQFSIVKSFPPWPGSTLSHDAQRMESRNVVFTSPEV